MYFHPSCRFTVRRTSTVLNTSESKIRTLYGPLLFVATVQCGYGSSKPTIAMAERGSMSGRQSRPIRLAVGWGVPAERKTYLSDLPVRPKPLVRPIHEFGQQRQLVAV